MLTEKMKLRENASYGQLLESLKTVPLFRCSLYTIYYDPVNYPCMHLASYTVADPEGDLREPWNPPFGLHQALRSTDDKATPI
jgi:hypothetical protein